MEKPTTIVVGSIMTPPYDRMFEQSRRVYSATGVAPTIHTMAGGHLEPKIIDMTPIICSTRGRSKGEWHSTEPHYQNLEIGGNQMSNSITSVQKDNLLLIPTNMEETIDSSMIEISADDEQNINQRPPIVRGEDGKLYQLRIRKLTERECFRLMDVDEKNIDLIQQAGISKSQQYKMAGNSIVVNVLYHIFDKLFCHTQNDSAQLSLFD